VDENPYSCEHVVPIEEEPRHHLVIANEFVRAFAVEIAPHERTLCHHHAHDYLMYVAGIADIVSAPQGRDPETRLYKDQECAIAPGGLTHVVENLRDTPFRNIVVEFLPEPNNLRRAAALWPGRPDEGAFEIGGKLVRVRQLFNDATTAAVCAVSITRGREIKICGPAIVASPYDYKLEIETAHAVINLSAFRNLAWLDPGSESVLRNLGAAVGRAVVFQLGSIG